ncbi:hypothetical protein EDD86DRAFT_198932 [Gorgonomyces haynaldii]|nr:hypothetical protein EDD86DRAFT_198932 [Gorgonomyces haynaldii]
MRTDIVQRLTDTSKYTGSHKERFDQDGKGKGIQGRKNIVISDGSTSSVSRTHDTVVSTERLHKIVVKPKTEQETFGVTPARIVLFQYADKNHAGETVVLNAKKFPSMKQVNDLTLKMTPSGKPKLLLRQDLTPVSELKDFTDGKYLVITAFDRSKLDEAKVPAKFRQQ